MIEMYITESLGHQTHENSTVLKFRSFQRKSRAFFFSEKGGLYRKKHRKGKIHKIHTCHFLEISLPLPSAGTASCLQCHLKCHSLNFGSSPCLPAVSTQFLNLCQWHLYISCRSHYNLRYFVQLSSLLLEGKDSLLTSANP